MQKGDYIQHIIMIGSLQKTYIKTRNKHAYFIRKSVQCFQYIKYTRFLYVFIYDLKMLDAVIEVDCIRLATLNSQEEKLKKPRYILKNKPYIYQENIIYINY